MRFWQCYILNFEFFYGRLQEYKKQPWREERDGVNMCVHTQWFSCVSFLSRWLWPLLHNSKHSKYKPLFQLEAFAGGPHSANLSFSWLYVRVCVCAHVRSPHFWCMSCHWPLCWSSLQRILALCRPSPAPSSDPDLHLWVIIGIQVTDMCHAHNAALFGTGQTITYALQR